MLRLALFLLAFLVVGAAAVWVFGPREPVDLAVRFDPAAIGPDPDAYLMQAEVNVADLRPDAAKEIVWAFPASRAKTPLAIVYVHGFSGSKAETRPLPDQVAAALGANLYFTRLTGHGRDGAAMTEAIVNDWLNDLAEAVAIGREIGERVVVIGTSTGATIATLGITVPDLADDVAGLVAISPNFRLRDWRSRLLTLPFARDIVGLVHPGDYGFDPVNAEHAASWTTRYPATALLPMAALVRAARRADIEGIDVPALFVYAPEDAIVDPEATEDVIGRWGAANEILLVEDSSDPARHVLAGRILSPNTTDRVAAEITAWIRSLPER